MACRTHCQLESEKIEYKASARGRYSPSCGGGKPIGGDAGTKRTIPAISRSFRSMHSLSKEDKGKGSEAEGAAHRACGGR